MDILVANMKDFNTAIEESTDGIDYSLRDITDLTVKLSIKLHVCREDLAGVMNELISVIYDNIIRIQEALEKLSSTVYKTHDDMMILVMNVN